MPKLQLLQRKPFAYASGRFKQFNKTDDFRHISRNNCDKASFPDNLANGSNNV